MTGVDVFNTEVAACTQTCFWVIDQGQVLYRLWHMTLSAMSLSLIFTPKTQR